MTSKAEGPHCYSAALHGPSTIIPALLLPARSPSRRLPLIIPLSSPYRPLVFSAACAPRHGLLCASGETVGACCAVVLVLPFAGMVAPIFGLTVLARSMLLMRAAAEGDQRALRLTSSGSLARDLRLSAAWNAASVPNAFVALAAFVAYSQSFLFPHSWMIPLCLACSKLLVAQAIKYVAAASGKHAPVLDKPRPSQAQAGANWRLDSLITARVVPAPRLLHTARPAIVAAQRATTLPSLTCVALFRLTGMTPGVWATFAELSSRARL